MNLPRGFVLLVRFVCELGLLAALAAWGADAGGVALGVAAPVVVAAFWGLFLGPKAPRRLPVQIRLMTEFMLFGFGALALNKVGLPVLAVAFGAAALGTSLLNASQEREAALPAPQPKPRPKPRRS